MMTRAILVGIILGTSLLGAGCEKSEAPKESTVIPRPRYVAMEPEGLGSRVTGYAWDPEAYFLNLFNCGGPTCPLPPLLQDNNPLVVLAMVKGARVTAVDKATFQQVVNPQTSDPMGTWTLPRVPSRESPPYFVSALGDGTRVTDVPFPLPSVPPAGYLPTVTLRPFATSNSLCAALEANLVSDGGILDAVAKYLSSKGTPTSVRDFINPAKYAGVTVVWLYVPGFTYWRLPARDTGIEATAGNVLTIEWAPPGALPPTVQSPRGFVVTQTSKVSSVGVSVVLFPAGASPGEVTYRATDDTTDAAQFRPWKSAPIRAAPAPGVISFAGVQLLYADESPAKNPSPSACVPR